MWDPVWEDIFVSREWGKYPSEDLVRFVARNFYDVPDRSAVRLLEVGCGPGANLWYVAREGFSFVGIDGSGTAIDKATSRLDAECPGWRGRGELKVGDIVKLPYECDSFDAVIDNEALYCNGFEAACTIYSEILRVLKPGGLLYSRTFASGSWGDGTGECIGRSSWLCSDGPLAGKGLSRFTAEDEIPILLNGFEMCSLEVLSWTMDSQQQRISEWLITARCPQS